MLPLQSNILIDDEGKAKLCDFSLSSIVVEFCGTSSLTSCIGGAPTLTPRSDIYSFGSVTLEILSGRMPYFYIKTDAQVVIEIHKGNKPCRPTNQFVTDVQWVFIQRCWAANTAEHLDAEEVGRAMRALHHASLEFRRHTY
ncbi:kinase-like domain-containing protein [Mycena olivaceomarginata]|nr:kinase-like domain-containing protein [Mycena olivaceomarginata]